MSGNNTPATFPMSASALLYYPPVGVKKTADRHVGLFVPSLPSAAARHKPKAAAMLRTTDRPRFNHLKSVPGGLDGAYRR